jgi:hypothetical protein
MYNFLILGIVRDIASTINEDYDRISRALEPLGKTSFFVVESDSSDLSLEALEKLSTEAGNFSFVSLGNLTHFRSRTERMAFARNRYLQELFSNKEYLDVTHVIICDFNNLNSKITSEKIKFSLARKNWDVCTANQGKRYYDIWALRHPIWSPNDCWEALDFQRRNSKFPELALYVSVHSRMIHIPSNSDVIEVESAFGGFAIYKRESIGKASYIGVDMGGRPICEHVLFHQKIRESGGTIIVDPQLINADWVDHTLETKPRARLFRLLKYPLKRFKNEIRTSRVVSEI